MKNRVLEALPARDRRLLSMQFTEVNLPRGTVLFEAGTTPEYVYFPIGAMVSYLSSTADGQSIETGLVGNEGVVGVATIFGNVAAFRAIVQIAGPALRISAGSLKREFHRSDGLRDVFLAYANALLIQIAQTAVCNKFHSVEARLCRWLLMAHDRSASNPLTVTHDNIGRILGTRRATITIVAGKLQRTGAIHYSRGVIRIVNRSILEAAVCECYATISAAHDGF